MLTIEENIFIAGLDRDSQTMKNEWRKLSLEEKRAFMRSLDYIFSILDFDEE
jgi:hypothetical protein